MDAHDVVHRVLEHAASRAVERRIVLEVRQRSHGADDEGIVALLDIIQTTSGQIDGARDGSAPLTQPQAAP